jgi:hypothetical protein
MSGSPRFQIVTEFAAFEGWRNCLAVDRLERPPRPVVLSFVPARVADAPERLARLAEDVERAARLHHPNVLRVLGMGTFGDQPVVLQEWRDGESLRELLDTGARVPPDVAARLVAEAAVAVHHAHGRAAEEGRPFAHGALRAERVLVGLDGTVSVSGFGRAAQGDGAPPAPADDVRSLGALLVQCLAGEQPSAGLPGVPDALATVAARAAEPGAPFATVDDLRKAIEAAVPLAGADRVRAWADSVLAPGAGIRGRRARSLEAALAEPAATPRIAAVTPPPRHVTLPELVSEEAIVAALTPPPRAPGKGGLAPAITPVASRAPEKTPEMALARPAPPAEVAWNTVAGAAAAALAVGLLLGVLLGR